MNPTINEKLNSLRKQLTFGEALGPSASYLEYLKDADADFLAAVAKHLKKAMGSKVDTKVHKGGSTVHMEIKGVNLSDMEVDLTVALHTFSWTDVKLNIWGEAGMLGRIDQSRDFKVGTLTPQAAADVVMNFLR